MKKESHTFMKKLIVFFLISLLFKPIWLFNNQDLGKPGNDDLSHWLHAATVVYDFDLDYEDDFIVEIGTFNYEKNTPYHPPGAGYLSAPFIFIFSLFDNQEPERLNPVGSFAYLGFFAASLFYCWMGLFLIFKTMVTKNLSKDYFIIFSVLVGTLAHFVTTRFVMSHAIEFFLCAYLCYLFEGNTRPYLIKNYTKISVVYLLLSLTRPSTFIYSLCFIIIYFKKQDYNLKNFYVISLNSLLIAIFHILTSLHLYGTYTIFQNYQTNLGEQSYLDFDLLGIILNTPKLVSLIFSPSLGIIWTIPVIIFGIIAFILNKIKTNNLNFLSNIFVFLYLYGASVVLIVWQGREFSFGQRLLIGIIPFCAIKLSEYKKSTLFNMLFYFFTWVSYLGYLYFYTSDNLNLKKGTTLWGTEVGFAGQDYFIFLFREILVVENIISMLGRTIYSVNLFSFTTIEKFSSILSIDQFISSEKLQKVIELTDIYSNVDTSYLFTVNVLIIIFCFYTTQLIFGTKARLY